jgi:hypothetical protein
MPLIDWAASLQVKYSSTPMDGAERLLLRPLSRLSASGYRDDANIVFLAERLSGIG